MPTHHDLPDWKRRARLLSATIAAARLWVPSRRTTDRRARVDADRRLRRAVAALDQDPARDTPGRAFDW
jgi:hypothetical protein